MPWRACETEFWATPEVFTQEIGAGPQHLGIQVLLVLGPHTWSTAALGFEQLEVGPLSGRLY